MDETTAIENVTAAAAPEREQVIVITGMSGAGKTRVINTLQDVGYFCVDNMPSELFMQFLDGMRATRGRLPKTALVIDVRGGREFSGLFRGLKRLAAENVDYRLVFMEASDAVLVSRYKETRRLHPLSTPGSLLLDNIREERRLLEEVRGLADSVIDTSDLSTKQLTRRISEFFTADGQPRLSVTVTSFGFKYGVPIDADLVMDVRFLPNPYYVEELRHLTGREAAVRDYVLENDTTREFLKLYLPLLTFSLPHYLAEGKKQLAIAIGCTGGQHRSVALADVIAQKLLQAGYDVKLQHRELERNKE